MTSNSTSTHAILKENHKQSSIVTGIIYALIALTLIGCAIVFYIGVQAAGPSINFDQTVASNSSVMKLIV